MPPFVLRAMGAILFCAASVYGIAYADLTIRARSAYLEGEKYLEWDRRPELKKAQLDLELSRRQGELRKRFAAGAELEQRLALAVFERDEAVKESSLKYAYVWFQTAVELFSPPESKWVVLSREKMALAKGLWKKELALKKIPYQDYMLE